MKSKAYAEINITSKKANLDCLDSMLSLSHSDYHEIGDFSKSGIKLDYSEWCYKTESIDIFYSEEITDLLCSRLEPNLEQLITFVNSYDCEVIVYIVIDSIGEVLPSLCINRKLISILEKMKGTVAFDGL
jgi:hypothetical protein